MRVKVPSSVVNNEYTAFPAGAYDGEITGAQVRDPNNDGSWVLIKLTVDGITPREGTEDPGRSKFSGDITLRNTDQDGNVQDIRELAEFKDLHWSIEQGVRLLSTLGAALGVAEVDEDGSVGVDMEALAETLVDGKFQGHRVAFEVENYTSKKNGKTYDSFRAFAPAA